jgi:hypothetical protein
MRSDSWNPSNWDNRAKLTIAVLSAFVMTITDTNKVAVYLHSSGLDHSAVVNQGDSWPLTRPQSTSV